MIPCLDPTILENVSRKEDLTHLGDLMTLLVDQLRNHDCCPNPYINDLTKLTWRLVGNKEVLFACLNTVQSLSFMVVGKNVPPERDPQVIPLTTPLVVDKQAAYLCPDNWLEQCRQNLTYCLGGVVFNASQCRDYYNNKLDRNCIARAMAYESEFLHLAMKHKPFTPDEYQSKVMKTYPDGIGTIRSLLYSCRPFMDAR